MRLPKPLLFGLCGLVGAVAGAALAAEPLWRWLSPPAAEVFEPQPLQVAASPSVALYQGGGNRFPIKLAREKFSGPVEVRVEGLPEGVSAAPVAIAADTTDGEINVFAEPDAAPGKTTVRVVAGAASGSAPVAPATCDIDLRVLFVEQPPAMVRLAVSPRLESVQGTNNVFSVRVVRDWFEGPVQIRAEEAPRGASVDAVTLEADRDSAELRVQVAADAPPGRRVVKLVATGDGIPPSEPVVLELEIKPRPVPKVDVIFVLDITGSMQYAIDGIQQGIADFARGLETADLDARVGLVAFRDQFKRGEGVEVVTFRGQPLTTDYAEFARRVGKLKADGGGDEEESSADAVALAARQPFRDDATKVLILVTDAPPKLPDKENRSLAAVVARLRRQGIDQVHLVVRPADKETYEVLQEDSPGRFFDLSTVSDGGVSFARILPDVSREIAEATIAGQPPPELAQAERPAPLPPTTRPAAEPPRPVPPPVIAAVQSRQAFAGESLWQLVAAVGISQGAVAAAICLALLAGQRLYLKRSLPSFGESAAALVGGFIAGLIGGGMAQLLQLPQLLNLDAFKAVAKTLGPWGKVPAWALLGGLAGFGVGRIVPNLGGLRGLVGGGLGGLAGAGGFLAATAFMGPAAGEFAGRVAGAGLLGLGIGLMVALLEAILREAWLEIHHGPERRLVTLGATPVSLGGDGRATVFVRDAPPAALEYSLAGGRVQVARGAGGRPTPVEPGHEEVLGKVRVVVCGAGDARRAAAGASRAPGGDASAAATDPADRGNEPVLWLRLSTGRRVRLVRGTTLRAADLPGVPVAAEADAVAEVVTKPSEPQVLGLKNLSAVSWSMVPVGGAATPVPPGRAVSLAVGARLLMGEAQGTVER